MKQRLMELISNIITNADDTRTFADIIATELIANGVIVPPCKVGDMEGLMTEKEKAKLIYEAKLEMLAEFEKKIKGYYYWIKGGTPAALVAYHVGVVADEIREKMEDEFYGTKTD